MRNLYRPSAALRLIVSVFLLCVLAVMALGQEKSYAFDLHMPTLASTTTTVKKTAGALTPNHTLNIAYDEGSHQFATLAQTSLKSFSIGPIRGRTTAFVGTEYQNPWDKSKSSGSVAGVGAEIDWLFRVRPFPHTQLYGCAGGGQGAESGSAGTHWLFWFGIGGTFKS